MDINDAVDLLVKVGIAVDNGRNSFNTWHLGDSEVMFTDEQVIAIAEAIQLTI